MKKSLFSAVIGIFALSLCVGVSIASANTCEDCDENETSSNVESITLSNVSDGNIKWSVDGDSPNGFKVVWSKNTKPTYPCREGDQYHYFSEADTRNDSFSDDDAFKGAGTYYVRVCEYLGGACGVYSNQVTITLGDSEEPVACTLEYAPVCGKDGKTYGNKCQAEAADAIVKYSGECEEESDAVESLTLTAGSAGALKWSIKGYSKNGFKVVWSKNERPTYPTRENDRYHYYSDATKRSDTIDAFDGSGTYYARVCEYLGGKCGVYSNQVEIKLTENAEEDEDSVVHSDGLTKITLSGEQNDIKWTANGYATNGFKIVWSKNERPTYPTRSGDTYHYLSSPAATSDFITPFDGNGTYYVRVCEYRDGECGTYSNQISVELTNAEAKGVKQIEDMREAASDLYNNRLDTLLSKVDELKSIIKEQQVQISYLMNLKDGLVQAISTAMETAIGNFIAYGVDDNTKNLGEGERAAVMYSFKAAFGKLPETESELEEAIKIANGRFPSIVSEDAENEAKAQFKKIYLRDADMNDAHDAAAIKVMAYGLRQKAENRNLHSEAAALKTFRAIFKKMPQTTEEWNALQAITYSGATR